MPRRLPLLLVSLLVLSIGVTAAPAQAAKRKTPFGFFGTVMPPEMMQRSVVSDLALENQMALMARSGVESVRVTFAASDIERAPGVYDYSNADRIVAAAARHRIVALINVTEATRWNSPRPNDPEWRRLPPANPAPWADMMRRLVLRYGSTGSFWSANPGLPKVPVRQWQIWNEQTAPWHWDAPNWQVGYTALLKATHAAIKQTDRRAQVIAGSLVAPRARYAPWDSARDLYRAGAKRYFDAIAIHPFTNNRRVRLAIAQTLEIVKRVRRQMRRRGDARKPILLTEMTWSAARGRIPRAARIGLETNPRGQAARLRAAYTALAKARRKLRVGQVDWYNWASQYDRGGTLSVMSFRYSGLTRMNGGTFAAKPLLRTYAKVAARYQGCRKSANARRCR